MHQGTDQLQMFGDAAWYSKQVPGHKYKKNYVSNFKVNKVTDI